MYIILDQRIKELREQSGLTQTELAKKMGVTRSSVNGWEMGISIPSIMKLVELALFFHVTTDYLLGMENENRIDIDALSDEERSIIQSLLIYFDKQKDSELVTIIKFLPNQICTRKKAINARKSVDRLFALVVIYTRKYGEVVFQSSAE